MIADIMTNIVQNMKSNFISKQSSAVCIIFFPQQIHALCNYEYLQHKLIRPAALICETISGK